LLFSIRSQIQGPILSKDISTLSDQLDNVSRQLQDRSIARELQSIGITMRELTLRQVKQLMKLQDDLVYRLAVLELQVQPLWRQVNQSISHLRTIQYYIDHQGEKIAQLVNNDIQELFFANYFKKYIYSIHEAESIINIKIYHSIIICAENKVVCGSTIELSRSMADSRIF